MAKADILSQIYGPKKSNYNFNFNALTAPPLLSMITVEDINYLHYLVDSPKFASKLDYKYNEIKKVLGNRGFRKLHAGTNRVVYVNDNIPNVVLKVCTNSIALTDNINEYTNQFYLAPFVTKVFEYSPCGTVGLFERVDPITSRQEFLSIADSVFELLNDKILGEFILEDIGSKYFMNWGIRAMSRNGIAFGPVLLDFPTMFRLDGKKLFCNNIDPITGIRCKGVINYDDGFNHLICPCCGKQYQARQLAKYEDDNSIIIAKSKGEKKMEILIKRGKETIVECNEKTSKVLKQNPKSNLEVSVEKETTVKPQVTTNTAKPEVDEVATLKFLFAKHPEVGAQLIQDKMYTIKKSDIDEHHVDKIKIGDYTYIREDTIKYECTCDHSENIEEISEEEMEEMEEVSENDFDENGNFKLEDDDPVDDREDCDNTEKLPFIEHDKTQKY